MKIGGRWWWYSAIRNPHFHMRSLSEVKYTKISSERQVKIFEEFRQWRGTYEKGMKFLLTTLRCKDILQTVRGGSMSQVYNSRRLL